MWMSCVYRDLGSRITWLTCPRHWMSRILVSAHLGFRVGVILDNGKENGN